MTVAMGAQDDLRQAIQLMQDGEVETAVGMLNRLVAGQELDDSGRAAAYVWLAESREDGAFKIRCLEQALAHEPENQQIRQGLEQLLAAGTQPLQKPAMLAPAGRTTELHQTPLVVGIVGGLNGLASGVFVNSAGLLATTSYAVGSAERVTVTLDAKRHLAGTIVRRFPLHDLALVETQMRLARIPSIAPPAMVADHTAFVALGYGGTRLRGVLQRNGRARAPHWLRTNLPLAQLPDAGGNPMVDENGQLLGILTRNADNAGNALGLMMSHIVALAEGFQRDRQLLPDSAYCNICGALTRARLYGGHHCETCGTALMHDVAEMPAPPQRAKLAELFGENDGPPCPNCGVSVGHYEGRCLRCGHAAARGAVAGA